MVTQVEIARRVGLDVSSVNKILNGTPGPVFRKETKALVFRTAKEMGYVFREDTKPLLKVRVYKLEAFLRTLIRKDDTELDMSHRLRISVPTAIEWKEFLYPQPKGRRRRAAAPAVGQ